MAKTYHQVMAEIERLKKQAEQLRQKEIAGVIARTREAIDQYGLTAADLDIGSSPKPAAAPRDRAADAGRKQKRGGVVRSRSTDGRTWSGFGRRPQWYLDAEAAGEPPIYLLAK